MLLDSQNRLRCCLSLCFLISTGTLHLAGQEPANELAEAKAEMAKFLQLPSRSAAAEKAKSFVPTEQDCAKVFKPAAVKSMAKAYASMQAEGEFVIGAPPSYTEVLITAVSTDDIITWSGSAREELAGGWKDAREFILPGHTMYIVRFVEPGKESGMRYDGLIKLGNKWVCFPKAWRNVPGAKKMMAPSPVESSDSASEPADSKPVAKDENIAGMSPVQASFELGWRMAISALLHSNKSEKETVDGEFRKAKLLTMAMLSVELKELPTLKSEGNLAAALAYILNTPGEQLEKGLDQKYGKKSSAAFRAANRCVTLLALYFADGDELSKNAAASMKRDLATCGVPKEVTAELFALLDRNAPRAEVTKAVFAYHTKVFNSLGPFKAPE